jgi:hypothetical protein
MESWFGRVGCFYEERKKPETSKMKRSKEGFLKNYDATDPLKPKTPSDKIG